MREQHRGSGIPQGGGVVQPGGNFQNMDTYQSSNQTPNQTGANVLDALKMYNNASGNSMGKGLGNMLGLGGGGATGSAIGAAMPAMSAGGGSSLGAMGLMSSAPAVSFPGAAAAGGTGAAAGGGGIMGSLGGMFGGGAGAGGAGAAGSGLMGAAMSNPWTAIAAAIIGAANYADNKGISSWKDTIMGKGGGNVIDYYSGRDDPKGNPHGFIGKLNDKDAAVGQSVKTMTDFSEGDFSNAFKHAGDTIKSIFKLKFF